MCFLPAGSERKIKSEIRLELRKNLVCEEKQVALIRLKLSCFGRPVCESQKLFKGEEK